jgi:chemotaxis signal transduction protein
MRGALDRAAVQEIAPIPSLSTPPSLPPSIHGVLNLAGKAVLVVDLARLMGAEPGDQADPLYRHLVILAGKHEGLALLVDRAEDVCRIQDDAIVRAGEGGSFNGCVVGHVEMGDASVHLLDADRIFLAAERERLNDLRHAEQVRIESMEST